MNAVKIKNLKSGDKLIRQVTPYSYCSEIITTVLFEGSRARIFIKNGSSEMLILNGDINDIVFLEVA